MTFLSLVSNLAVIWYSLFPHYVSRFSPSLLSWPDVFVPKFLFINLSGSAESASLKDNSVDEMIYLSFNKSVSNANSMKITSWKNNVNR